MTEETLAEVSGDGSDAPVSEPLLGKIKDEIAEIARECRDWFLQVREDADDARLCRWDGQDPDGRKHAENLDSEPAQPFEGACDSRVRMADMLTNEDVQVLTLAALRAQWMIKPIEASDQAKAGRLSVLLRWVLRNQLGAEWVREVIRLANYYTADSPAVAAMLVDWRREQALEYRDLALEELLEQYVAAAAAAAGGGEEARGAAEEAARQFVQYMEDPVVGQEFLGGRLREMFPHLTKARAAKIVAELADSGRAEFPAPYLRRDGVRVRARRLFDQFYLPSTCENFDSADLWFSTEWMSEQEVRAAKEAEGWSEEFVEQLLGAAGGQNHAGELALPQFVRDTDGSLREATPSDFRNRYQVVRAYFVATNIDDVPARYTVTLHPGVSVAAHERRMLRDQHGGWPAVVFQREVIDRRVVDSRGIPELAAPLQGVQKLMLDAMGDNGQLNGVPPIVTRGRRSMGALYIRPLEELQAKRDGDYKWLAPPPFPATIDKMLTRLDMMRDEYFGRPNPALDPSLAQIKREFTVAWWLAQLREVVRIVVALYQQYADDATLQRITNRQGEQLIASREEIQGQFDLDVAFDVRDMDPEYIKSLAEIVKNLLMAMDASKVIDGAAVVGALLWRLSPDLADAALRPVDRAVQDELEDEVRNLLKIRAGMEPEMDDSGGQNYAARLSLYQAVEAANPDAFRDMPADKVGILEARLKHLTMMSQQFGENVQIGRTGARPALADGGSVAGGQG